MTPQELVALREFLEDPPSSTAFSFKIANAQRAFGNFLGTWDTIQLPETLRFFCGDSLCMAEMFFDWDGPAVMGAGGQAVYLHEITLFEKDMRSYVVQYKCRHCKNSIKALTLLVIPALKQMSKTAEFPQVGEPLPEKLLDLADYDRELLIQGYKAELEGFGIGAAAYYRRIVEDRKEALIVAAKSVAQKMNASSDTLALFDRAKDMPSFDNAIKLIKDAVPTDLFIEGKNPLTLLHHFTSMQLHDMTDTECLEVAESLRLVLITFSQNVERVLRERVGLQEAVKRLEKRLSSNGNVNS
jgi:hypothetical protein